MARKLRHKKFPAVRLGLVALCLASLALLAHAAWTLPSSDQLDALVDHRPKSTALIDLRARQAADVHRPFHPQQSWAPLDEVAPELIACVLASEDARFFEHDGVDLHQIRDALARDLRARHWVRGASTLTQQLAKNLWLSENKTLLRKLTELVLAERLEQALSKKRILELYLNEAEWGQAIFGVGAASQAYFNQTPRALSLAQSAILAAMLPAPRQLSPLSNPRGVLPRALHVLDRVAEERLASPAAISRARDELLRALDGPTANRG
jgi:monofunctional glycosyltransferase